MIEAPVRFYAAKIFHARLRPHPHRFTYRMLSMAIDVDRLEEAGQLYRLFSTRRFAPVGFSARDHGPCDGSPLRPHICHLLARAGVADAPTRIELMAFPRLFGFAFNPLSVFYCYDAAGLVAIVYEVRNTFGQRHSYVVPTAGAAPQERDKQFFVSPFMDMSTRYRFITDAPGEALSLKIIERDAQGVVLTALMTARALPPTDAALAKALLAQPLLGFKTLAGIHWEAARLWAKGHRLRARPDAPPPASFDEPGAYSSPRPPHRERLS